MLPPTLTLTWDAAAGYVLTATPAVPPVVIPSPGATGVQAARLADMIEGFGLNTYSSPDASSSRWGSWPGDNSQASVVAGIKALSGNSGMVPQLREYHYPDERATLQATFCPAVFAETGSRYTMALGGGADISAVPTIKALAQASAAGSGWLRRVEGLNEPNTDFGSGTTPPATTIAIQVALKAAMAGLPIEVCGPSVVFGLPYPEGYMIPGYASALQMAQMGVGATANAHLYPPTSPDQNDGSTRGGAMRDTAQGITNAYAVKQKIITEWHPTIFGDTGHNLDPLYDCYYAPLFILSAFREGFEAYFWYSMVDFGWDIRTSKVIYASGLWPQAGGVAPRPVFFTLQAMFQICPDRGADRHTFTPGRLDYKVTGGPGPDPGAPNTGTQTTLLQASTGTFVLYLENSQVTPEGPTTPVTISFPSRVPTAIKAYKVSDALSPSAVRQSLANAASITIPLNAAVWALVITP